MSVFSWIIIGIVAVLAIMWLISFIILLVDTKDKYLHLHDNIFIRACDNVFFVSLIPILWFFEKIDE